MQETKTEKSFLFFLGIALFLVIASLTAYSYYQKIDFEKNLARLNIQNQEISASFSEKEVSDTLNLFSAKEVLDKLDEESLKWSKVLKEILNTVPKDEKGNMKLDIVAYSGSGSSDLTLNVSTVPGSSNPFFDVADFIKAFDGSSRFLNNFVPSISSGITAEGRAVLTFSFSTQFSDQSSLISR